MFIPNFAITQSVIHWHDTTCMDWQWIQRNHGRCHDFNRSYNLELQQNHISS